MAKFFRLSITRWVLWFFLGNILLACIIGLNYLPGVSWLNTPYFSKTKNTIIAFFLVLAGIGQFGLLTLAASVPSLILVFVRLKKFYVFFFSVLFAIVLATLFWVDTIIFKLCHFHLSGIVMTLVLHGFGGEVLGVSSFEYLWFFSFVGLVVFLELIYAWLLWRYLYVTFFSFALKWILLGLGMSLFLSYASIAYSHGYVMQRILLDASRALPFYVEIFNIALLTKHTKEEFKRSSYLFIAQPSQMNVPLHYPLTALNYSPINKKLNIVIIVIDAWRFDMLNARTMPNVAKFAEKSLVFSKHSSGGNATGPGIFSIFYGLPATYWTSMNVQQRGPILIDELIKQNYQMGVFSSAGIEWPAFSKNVFSALKIKNIKPAPGKNPYERDQTITSDFIRFIQNLSPQKPFFSFLMYDAAHGYCELDNQGPFLPIIDQCNRQALTNKADPTPYFNRYKNALFLLDGQIKLVIQTLAAKNLLDDTIVLITGDHGEEFNDNHLSFWGHASNFTQYQIGTPLVVHWPGKKPTVNVNATSHFDIAPTLLEEALGIQNLPIDYSIGHNLFKLSPQRSYLIVGSYANFGVVEEDRIMSISSVGDYEMQLPSGAPATSLKVNEKTIHYAFQDISRFFKKNRER